MGTRSRTEPSPALSNGVANRVDEQTFKKWVEDHRPQLLSVAAHFAHGSVGAEDLVQEAVVAAYRVRHTLQDPDAVESWLTGILLNVGRQEARKDARRGALLEVYVPTMGTAIGPSEDVILTKLDVRKAIDELPEVQRTVVIYRWFMEMSHREIAETIGRKEGTVRSDLCRAHRALRKKLAGYADHASF